MTGDLVGDWLYGSGGFKIYCDAVIQVLRGMIGGGVVIQVLVAITIIIIIIIIIIGRGFGERNCLIATKFGKDSIFMHQKEVSYQKKDNAGSQKVCQN